MYSNIKLPVLIGLLQVFALVSPAQSQTPVSTTNVSTTTTTKHIPLAKSVTKTTTTVVKTRPAHLRKRAGKKARAHYHTRTKTTVVRKTAALSGGVAKTHKHHVQTGGSAQAARSAKLNAFLKNPPKMKKTPYFNPPGLNVPSSPAI